MAHVHSQRPGPGINAALQRAYDVFNHALWPDAPLPDCVLLWARKPRSLGYFSRDRWSATGAPERAHEIALNPDHIRRAVECRGPERVARMVDALSTIPHEQCHLWQAERGRHRPRRAYHNREFANEMARVGLQCSDTGQPGGRVTGSKMSHYVLDGGLVDRAARGLLAQGFTFDWSSEPQLDGGRNGPRQGQRAKYVAPCSAAVWGRPGLALACLCPDCDGARFAER